MRCSRRGFIARTAAIAAVAGAESSPEATAETTKRSAASPTTVKLPAATLHGYGTLSGGFQTFDGGRSSVTRILCESPQKARLTQAKYLSDLHCLPGIETASVPRGGRTLPCYRTATGGMVACYAHGNEVRILAATDAAGLARRIAADVPPSAAPTDFQSRASVPMYLDRWDRHGLLCYFAPDVASPESGYLSQSYDYADALTFAQRNAVGLVIWTNPLVDDYAEGITNVQSWEWAQANARKMGIPLHINTQISYPQLWLSNRYRDQTMLNAPQFLGGYYGVGHDSAGTGAISWLSQEAEDAQLGVFQHIVRRFAGDPNIVGWLEPHGETGEMPQKFFLDSGPYTDEVLRAWLRARYKTLAAISERWHGDPAHYRSWSDVHAPEIAELAGFSPDAIDLRGVWRVKYVPAPDGRTYTRDEARGLPSPPPTMPVPPEWMQPGFDDSGWDTLIAPGNDRMLVMTRSPLVYRRTIEIPADWPAAHPHPRIVIWDLVNRDRDATIVTLNGQPLPEQAHRANDQHWSEFDASGALKSGPNLLALQMPRGIICYRAYITGDPPLQYPRLGPQKNAIWADMVDWNIGSRGAQIRRGAEMIRQVDPDRSINFMAADDYSDPIRKICQDYGGRFHDTGGMAGYWTEWNTLMMCGLGLPVTAEAGNGAPNPREFQLFWGRWLTEGLTGVHYFQNWGEIAWNPEVLKVFEANRTMYQAVGKYHVPFARVAVLFGLQNQWLNDFPWTPEPDSRGGYNSTFNAAGQLLPVCPRDGISAPDFGTPVVSKYRVIIDSNTSFMDETLVDGIEAFVREGGVFITNGQTGRHTPVHPDTWQISRLTGYRVAAMNGWGDARSAGPAPGQTVFAPGELPTQTRCAGLRLQKSAADTHDLLLWDDGTVAAGMRQVGKGWIVHFGPMLFGEPFVAMMTGLLRHFGITNWVPATVKPQRGLHMRHFIGNTGLHDIWVLFNESDGAVTTDLKFRPGVHPAALTDIVSGQRLDIVRDPGGDFVRDLALSRWESRMYVSPRSDVAASPLEWLTLQRGWWQGTVRPPARHLPTPQEQQHFTLDLTEGWSYKSIAGMSDDQAAAPARPELNDSTWERRPLDLWLTPGDRSPKRLFLRRKFTVPAHWTAGKIALSADIPYAQFFFETRMFLDGVAWNEGRKTVDGPYFDTLGGVLKPGTTHVIALDIQSKSTLTGSRGPMWLSYVPEPQARQDLAGAWSAYSDPLHRVGEVSLPGHARAMYLTRSVVIDPAHSGRNVIIHFETLGDRFDLIFNGRLIRSAALSRQHAYSFNVTPLVQFGADNLIELAANSGANDKEVSVVEIRFYDRGVYP